MQMGCARNEAHQRLKDPLKRAAYLCELGVPIASAQQYGHAGRLPDANKCSGVKP